MFSVNDISIHFSGTDIFSNVSFLINQRDRIGLVGRNGAGKTTLLRIMNREIDPNKGSVVIPGGNTVGYLPQEMKISSTKNIFDEALLAFSEAISLEAKIADITRKISELDDYTGSSYGSLVESLNRSNERYAIIGGHTKEADTEKVLLGLGFAKSDFQRPMNEFSGGWQMRVELAKILLSKPDLLLLDEPTNHLDIESIQWLEDFLRKYPGAILLVSHDRALLDNVTNRTIEISMGRIFDYKESYSNYVILREEERERTISSYNNQQRQIAQIERFIERFRYKNTKASQVQSRIKSLEKLDKIEVEEVDNSSLSFSFPPAPRGGKVVFSARKLSKRYGDNLVINNMDLDIIRNDAIAFVGKNGEGKSTLSKIIVGQTDFDGSANLGYNITIGYFAQNQAELLDPGKTVYETLDEVTVGEMRTKIRGVLGNFLFSGDAIDKRVKVLSGGEKSRLAIARLLMIPVNLLVLDEPTNHLDMRSKDILKHALLNYDGTLIIVSHDRDFLQGLTGKVFEFRNKKIHQYNGDIYDFLSSRKLQSLDDIDSAGDKKQDLEDVSVSDQKLAYEKRKQLERDKRKVISKIEKEESRIADLENRIEGMKEVLSDPVVNKEKIEKNDLYSEFRKVSEMLEVSLTEWENLQLKLESLENNN